MTNMNILLAGCAMFGLLFVHMCRDEIAACAEKAYQCISLPEATRMLYFDGEKSMRTFADKVNYPYHYTLLLWTHCSF